VTKRYIRRNVELRLKWLDLPEYVAFRGFFGGFYFV